MDACKKKQKLVFIIYQHVNKVIAKFNITKSLQITINLQVRRF